MCRQVTYIDSGEGAAGEGVLGVVPWDGDVRSFAEVVVRELRGRLAQREAEERFGGREGGGLEAGRQGDGGLRQDWRQDESRHHQQVHHHITSGQLVLRPAGGYWLYNFENRREAVL